MSVERHTTATASVLIVDDDQAVREGLAAILEGAGYTVLVAETFERGRDALRTTEPDLLIVDVRLGDFNGLQLLATSVSPIRAIVLTGFADSARDSRATARAGRESVAHGRPAPARAVVTPDRPRSS
jgi:DNA-binding response OmpR family regulator